MNIIIQWLFKYKTRALSQKKKGKEIMTHSLYKTKYCLLYLY